MARPARGIRHNPIRETTITAISWVRCSAVYTALTLEQRRCMKALRVGDISSCDDATLAQFAKLGLVHRSAGAHALTAEGRVISGFCLQDADVTSQ